MAQSEREQYHVNHFPISAASNLLNTGQQQDIEIARLYDHSNIHKREPIKTANEPTKLPCRMHSDTERVFARIPSDHIGTFYQFGISSERPIMTQLE